MFGPSSTTTEALLAHLKGLHESASLKRQLKQLLIKEREDVLGSDSSNEQYQYYKERAEKLEAHVTILEDFKREAESALLLLEEENAKLKAQVLELDEALRDSLSKQGEGCWQMENSRSERPKKTQRRIEECREAKVTGKSCRS